MSSVDELQIPQIAEFARARCQVLVQPIARRDQYIIALGLGATAKDSDRLKQTF